MTDTFQKEFLDVVMKGGRVGILFSSGNAPVQKSVIDKNAQEEFHIFVAVING